MDPWLEQFFFWLPDGTGYYLLIGLIALGESLVAVGLLLPGSTLCVAAGFLALHGRGEIVPLILAAAGGAFLGDLLSFILGARAGGRILRLGFMRKRIDLVRRAEQFFGCHGGKSVFFGRFFGPVRGFIPFVAGGAGMSLVQFLGFALVSALLWGLAYPGLGYLAGASWENVERWSGRFAGLIGVVLLVTLAWFYYRHYRKRRRKGKPK